MEGLRQFEAKGLEATLLLHTAMQNQAPLFDGTYSPKVSSVSSYEAGDSGKRSPFWLKATQRFRKAQSLVAAILSLNPDIIIVNDPESCRVLWLSSLLMLRKPPTFVTFVHGSPFQFVDDLTKYSLIFRRHFADIRKGDSVYREVIPTELPPITLPKRISLEINCFLKYLALRHSRYIFVISQKNRREVELLYNYSNVIVISAGGFSSSDFTYQRRKDMKVAVGIRKRYVILSICRLVSKKRVDLSVRAFAELIRNGQRDDCVMVIAGAGPHESTLRSLAIELQIENKVEFVGYVPEEQLRDWYCSCDVFVSADNADHDLSVYMALALGCKVVVSTQYDIPEFLDKVRRFIFVAEPSIQGFAQTMEKAIRMTPVPLNAADFGELDNMTWERYFQTILSLAEKLLCANKVTN
ncbi:MAG: glycosyltransferase [Candidatus Aminicenantes bacterium]|nr:glycosyltransferase [Candidatus Aminicenantes bacterium]